jgi:phage terminase small subunit
VPWRHDDFEAGSPGFTLAIRGYSENGAKVRAFRLLKNANVSEEIEQPKAELMTARNMT